MIAFFAILVAVLTFVFVAYPLFRQRLQPSAPDSIKDTSLQELQSRQDTTYSMLKELEFDFQSGMLTEEDYRDLAARYRGKAISILKNMDTLAEGSDVEDEIEKQVLASRQKKGSPETPIDDQIETRVLSLRQRKRQFCPQCGASHEGGARFCARCGVKLVKEEKC